MQSAHSASKRWRKSYKEDGVVGLSDIRKLNSGRPRAKDLFLEEKYSRLEAKLKLLQVENELLKKLDMIEGQALKKK